MTKHLRKIPGWFKWVFVAFMLFYVPIYWAGYGLENFLWISSVVLILAFVATVTESRFVASMAAVGGLVPELMWVGDFVFTLVSMAVGSSMRGFGIYMFDPSLGPGLRVIGLFHLALPVLLVWLVVRLGYDRRAWMAQLGLTWVLLLVARFVADPGRHINLVGNRKVLEVLGIGATTWFLVLMAFAVVMILAAHLFFVWIQRNSLRSRD